MKKATPLYFLLVSIVISCQSSDRQDAKTGYSEASSNAQVISLSARDLYSQITEQEGIIVDVRTPQETATGKISGAISLDFYSADFSEKALKLPRDQKIWIYCSAGVRSQQAAQLLIQNGYTQVYHLSGGLGPWLQAGFPLEP